MSETDVFCREIEAHLCRRNGGHLVRLVGPAFEMVVGWARQGIPLKVACGGIDRFFERDLAKDRNRRRPVRIEFCEADVLDAFDEWGRAVGIGTAAAGGTGATTREGAHAEGEEDAEAGGGTSAPRPGRSLREHLDRVVIRLTDALATARLPGGLDRRVEEVLDELSGARESSRTLRGTARQQFLARLQQLDDLLMASAVDETGEGVLAPLRAEAERELAGFRGRMAEDDYRRALAAAAATLLRERLKLPVIGYGL